MRIIRASIPIALSVRTKEDYPTWEQIGELHRGVFSGWRVPPAVPPAG